MTKSAGIILYRDKNKLMEFLLVHPGGPFWKNKDAGVWSIPKGEISPNEKPFVAATREFEEETGLRLAGDFIELTPIKQKSGKIVYAWALKQDMDADNITCNTFEIEWPPKSGKRQIFPEIDKAGWFSMIEAKKKIIASQIPLIEELLLKLT